MTDYQTLLNELNRAIKSRDFDYAKILAAKADKLRGGK